MTNFLETMWSSGGEIPLLEYHLQRLRWGLFQNDVTAANQYIREARKIITANCPQDDNTYKLRYLLPISKSDKNKPHLEIHSIKKPPLNIYRLGFYRQEYKTSRLPWNAKTTNRDFYAKVLAWAQTQNLDDGIIFNEKSHVVETSVCNIFILKKNTIYTPPLFDYPVKGVMRTWLMENSVFPIIEQSLTEQDILSADLILLSNALRGIQLGKILSD